MKEWRYQLKQSWWKSFFRQPENQKKDWFIRADNKGIHFLAELLPENDLVQQSVTWHELIDLYVVENWAIVLQLDELPDKKGCFYYLCGSNILIFVRCVKNILMLALVKDLCKEKRGKDSRIA